jgi:hypothetical protein
MKSSDNLTCHAFPDDSLQAETWPSKAEGIQHQSTLLQSMALAKVAAELVLAIEHLTTVGAGVEGTVVLPHVAAILFAAAKGIGTTVRTLKLVRDGYPLSGMVVWLIPAPTLVWC